MWLFTKHGHLNLVQDDKDPESLTIYSQMRNEIDSFVTLLDSSGEQKHHILETVDGDYRFFVTAKKAAVAQAVACVVKEIDYGRFMQSVHVDFGKEPGYLLWLNATGLQVARVKPE